MKKTLVNYYLLVTLLFSAFVIISLTALYVKTQHDIFIQNSQEIHTKVLDNYKRELKNRVELIEQQIQYKKASTEVRLKESIKSRVYEAHAIAESIYANNVGKIDDSAIQKLIVETLRNIRFNQGRGYYFIGDKKFNTRLNMMGLSLIFKKSLIRIITIFKSTSV